ncbi:MAG: chemotaxis protein CheA, partial [Acidobacteriota bacterium]
GAPHPESAAVKTLLPAVAGSSVRVSVEQLGALMNLVGELVVARNEIAQLASVASDPALRRTSQRLSAITTQLQAGITKTRMQPIDHAWSKLTRVVRDAAQQCGKRVRLEMDGRETELDRTLIEAIQGPLTQVVRNCVDHGIETPALRLAAGKSAEGRLALRAFHEGGQVVIEVSDDGGGVDLDAIRRKALARGVITPRQAREMSQQDVTDLIFLPGLSTAATVTSLSGRGVGMDVVKTNIEQVGGKVSIHSEAGTGTTVRMRVPLTLAIITALVIVSGEQTYAIPHMCVVELARLEAEEAAGRIETVGEASVYRLRGEPLPLVWLSPQLAGAAPLRAPTAAAPADATVVVLQANGHKFGLIVDEVRNAKEIVVKPLGRCLRRVVVFAGATVLGDGKVALILDVPALAQHASVFSGARTPRTGAVPTELNEPTEPLLLLGGAGGARMAVPLAQITRLETFPRSSLEHADGRQVVRYRGGVLALEDLASLRGGPGAAAPQAPDPAGPPLHALVYSRGGRHVGVIAERIFDTVDERLSSLRPGAGRGLAASIIIDGQATAILDLDALCARAVGLPTAATVGSGAGA